MLKEFFASGIGSENLVDKQEAGTRALQVSVEETPASYVLVATVPTSSGEVTRLSRFARSALLSADAAGTSRRLSKELIWQQQEPILDAAELGEDQSKPGSLLILGRDRLSLYRRDSNHWELQDARGIPPADKTTRTPRGEIRLSSEGENSVLLPDQICDLEIGENLELNCRKASHPWREGAFLASPCDRNLWWLHGGQGDRTVPDRLSLRNPSLGKSASPEAELDLPGPAFSVFSGQRARSDTAVVFNLLTGNYEVYRITLACAN